jgi:hypothetical protein
MKNLTRKLDTLRRSCRFHSSAKVFVIVLTGALSVMRKANVNMMRRTSVERAVSQELMAARAR